MDVGFARWTFVAVGLLFVGINVPLALGKIPPNWFYGFRTRKTLSSPEIWYPANRAAGRDGAIAGVVITIASVVIALALHDSPAIAVFIDLAILVGALAVVVVRAFVNLSRF